MNSNYNKLKDSNIAKIAVQFKNYPAQLIEFDQRQSLDEIISQLCNFPDWRCSHEPDMYALQFVEPNYKKYVTEENRGYIKNGTILLLTQTVKKIVNDIIKTLDVGSTDNKLESLITLNSMAKDVVFATEFIKKKNGLNLLVRIIDSGGKYTGDVLKYTLLSLTELMGHGIVPWSSVESLVIKPVINFLEHEQTILEYVLDFLDNIVQNSSNPQSIDIKFDSFILIFEKSVSNELITQKSLALINSLFRVATDEKKAEIAQTFKTKKYRDVIHFTVSNMEIMSNELNYQLYVFQTMLLSLFKKRVTSSVCNDEVLKKLDSLKQIAFADERNSANSIRDCPKKLKSQNPLGFNFDCNIEESFWTIPPGLLTLDCLEYFAKNYPSTYKIITKELIATNNEYGFPLGQIANELVKLLCDIFKVGEPPSEQTGIFYPIFFSHDEPFYEIFCIGIEILNQNWKDMKAVSNDLKIVILVGKEQIERTLNSRPVNITTFKRSIKSFTYNKIIMFRELERALNEEYESSVPAIVDLKVKITPQMVEIIKKQRLSYLINGSRFHQYSKSGQRLKNKSWYARLSPNHKTLHYGDWNENGIPVLENLEKAIEVSNIKELLVGKECSIVSRRKHQTILTCLFEIVYLDETQQPCELEFIASDELTQNYWVDGISTLLNLEMASSRYHEDLDALMSMEIKLRLLDTEGIVLDKNAPSIPPDPEDYDF